MISAKYLYITLNGFKSNKINSYIISTIAININTTNRGCLLFTRKEIEILELRKKNLTQSEVAKKLKITQAAVSKFEKNAYKKILDAKKILIISNKIGVDIDEEEF